MEPTCSATSPNSSEAVNSTNPSPTLPAQSFGEGILGIGARVWLQPWLNVSVVEGVSYNSSVSLYEKTFRENYSQLLNYLGFEVEAAVSDDVSLVGRIHHRSGAFGTYNGVTEGSNAYLLGLRYRWEQDPVQPSEAVMPPPGAASSPQEPGFDRPRWQSGWNPSASAMAALHRCTSTLRDRRRRLPQDNPTPNRKPNAIVASQPSTKGWTRCPIRGRSASNAAAGFPCSGSTPT